MRVVLDCRMATWTGVGRYTVGLARALAARGDLTLVQLVAAGEEPPVSATEAGAEPVFSAKHPFSFGAASEFARVVREARADVTHCAHFPTPVPAPHPLVVTMHDLSPLLVAGVMPSAFRRGVYRWWNGRAASAADAILTDAQFTVDEIERVFPAARGRVTPVLLGVDDFTAVPAEPLPAELAALTTTPYVLSMGSTRVHKDLPTLLSAFARVAPAHPELSLLLVGAGEDGYVDRALPDADASLRDRIAFTGRVSDGVLRTLMLEAAVFAFPSRYEGFGLPPLEAMALGTPVVCSDAASLPEVVGDAALLFAAGDVDGLAGSIARCLSEPELRARLSAAGLTRAATFTWARTAEQTVAVYERVAAGARGDGAARGTR